MKPAWEQLTNAFAGNSEVVIADVDCTAEGKDLCEEHGIQGFPTIKYGDPSALEDYEGGRDFEALKAFADENLKASCSPSNIDLCDADKKKEIEDIEALSADDLASKIDAKETELKDAEADFEAAVEKLQAEYEELSKGKDAKVAAVKASGLSVMKAVRAKRAKAESAEL